MAIFKSSFMALAAIFLITGCTDDDDDSIDNQNPVPINPNQEELITTVVLDFQDTNATTVDEFYFRDLDGEGGNPPQIDTIFLDTQRTYQLNLRFLDESNPNDVEDITTEIRAEDDEHLVCFESSQSNALLITKTDSDGIYPIGLSSEWQTFDAFNGSLKLTLKHQPGVKNGSCSPGETDVEVDFPLIIKP